MIRERANVSRYLIVAKSIPWFAAGGLAFTDVGCHFFFGKLSKSILNLG